MLAEVAVSGDRSVKRALNVSPGTEFSNAKRNSLDYRNVTTDAGESGSECRNTWTFLMDRNSGNMGTP